VPVVAQKLHLYGESKDSEMFSEQMNQKMHKESAKNTATEPINPQAPSFPNAHAEEDGWKCVCFHQIGPPI